MSIFQKIKNSVMRKSRNSKLEHFYSLCHTNSSVLDVGVSNCEHNDSVNLFLRKFRLCSKQDTGLAVELMNDNKKKNPEIRLNDNILVLLILMSNNAKQKSILLPKHM